MPCGYHVFPANALHSLFMRHLASLKDVQIQFNPSIDASSDTASKVTYPRWSMLQVHILDYQSGLRRTNSRCCASVQTY